MLTRSHISGREGLALGLLVVLPLLVMFALAFRAAANERAAVQSSMQAELEREATRAGAAYQHTLRELDARMNEAQAGLAPTGALAPFVQPLSVTAEELAATPRAMPSPSAAVPPAEPPAAAADCAELAADLSALVRDASRVGRFLQQCRATKTAGGRHAWPLVALHPAAAARPELAALRSWIGQFAASQSDVARAAMQLELAQASWLAADVRAELAQLAAVSPEGHSRWLAWVREKVRQRPDAKRLSWANAQSRGWLVRGADGGYTGYLVDRASLSAAVAAGWPAITGVSAQLAGPQPDNAFSFEVLPGASALALSWEDPGELSRRTGRSRQLLLSSALAAALLTLVLVWLLWSRLRQQRQLSALRTDFVAAVSHELRTPIASLRMLSELLSEDALDPEEVPEARRALVREAARLGETVDQLLSFSRMQAGKLKTRREHCDLSALVEATVSAFEQRHGLTVARSIAEDLHAEVDSAAITMVLRNLLDNARKHAPGGTPYQVSLQRQQGGVALAVRDHGPGVPKRHWRRIFQPFERVDDRLTEATEGSGIGLSLVRHVANGHGGRVSVTSEPGKGAEFTLWLPGQEG